MTTDTQVGVSSKQDIYVNKHMPKHSKVENPDQLPDREFIQLQVYRGPEVDGGVDKVMLTVTGESACGENVSSSHATSRGWR